jgi:hypothetical protein
VLALLDAGVEPLALTGEVAAPVEPVADQVAAGSLDDPGRDGPAGSQGLVVAQVLVLGGQVADAGAGPQGAARPAASASAAISAAARALSPASTASALTATQSSAAGFPAAWRHQAAFQMYSSVDEVDHDVDGGAASACPGADQAELVLGPVDQDHPRPPARRVAGLGLAERGGDRFGQIVPY